MDFRPFWDVLADLGIRLPDAARLKKRQADSSPDAPPVEKKQPSNPPVPPRPEIKLRGRANPGSPQMEGPLELFDMLRQLMGETSRQGQGQGQPPLSDRNWLPPDQTQTVAGHEIPGMVYVGDHLFSLRSYNQVEPSLIRPNLKVANFKPPRPSQDQTSYACPFLSYSEFTALERGAYLHWLASGRRTPEVDWNFVWLFFYGLERRVFYDYLCDFRAFQQDVAKQAELSQIMAEVEDLQQFYGDRPSFPTILQTKFTQFLLLGRLLQHPHPSLLADDPDPLQMPLPHLLVALGEKMASGEAIAPDWAFAWYTRLSSNRLKGSVSRCPDEFQTLFQLRYNKKHPKGWTVKPSIAPLVIPYYAASPSFGGAVQLPFQHLADATRLLHLIREIGKIIGSCTEAIEPLTRFLARNPDSRYAPTAIALLPPELLPTHGGELMQRFQECLDFYFEDEDTEANVLYGNELLDYWPGTNPDRLTKSEAEGLSKFLERLGFGIEPDVRFGGAAPKATSRLMLFRLPEAHPAQLAPEYATATLMAHLAIATASGTQPPNAIEQAAIFDQLNHFADWHPAERTRLQAYYHLLLEEKPTLKGLKSRVEALAPEQRDAIAPWLITIAAADGQLTPKEIQQIEKVYTLLGRDPKTLYSDIHAISTNTLKTNR
ncbi:MAG: TerB N-terminal domain-containing protein, partial [Oculatellaceae cyanobacterium Prado106]|nr:TerB N-terminal domain-containing protein [Oculatellaceae cyanobacterium Prado106]